jgi:putative sterol carrier protein
MAGTVFADAEELYKVWQATIDKVEKNEALLSKFTGLDMVVGIKVPNLDACITMEMRAPLKVTYGPSDVAVDVNTTHDDDILNKFWQGKLNLVKAMAKGQVKSTGALTKTMKMLPVLPPVYKMYIESLKEIGRGDLVL